MFHPDISLDLPAGSSLLAEIGIDPLTGHGLARHNKVDRGQASVNRLDLELKPLTLLQAADDFEQVASLRISHPTHRRMHILVA